jgi:hypothetical protein
MVFKKTRNRIKRLLKRRRKTRRLRGGSTEEEERTNKIVKGVVTDVIKELKSEGVLTPSSKDGKDVKGSEGSECSECSENGPSKKAPEPRKDTFSDNRPTGIVEQILLAPVRIPAKFIKLPFKLYKAPIKFLKKFVF